MSFNEVWDFVVLLESYKSVGYKWVFKTKQDLKVNIERYKARLVTKGFTQKDDIDYKETFFPVSKNNSFRIILAIMTYCDLELHQIDVKTAFLDGNLKKEVYTDQPKGFIIARKDHIMCKRKGLIYGLKQASKKWYLKLNNTITFFGFKKNTIDLCIYQKVSGSKFMFLILYIDGILLATNDLGMML